MQQATKSSKKSIQETNINYEYNIVTKRPRPNKNKDKQQVQDEVPMPYQLHPDESMSQGTTPCEFFNLSK
jgi:hypothetical protein